MTAGSGGDRWGRWIGLAVGLPVMAFGVGGVLADADRTNPAELARWVVGGAVVHDGVLIPMVLAVGWAVHRKAPAWLRAPLNWAAATSMVLVLFSWPFVRGYGRNPTVPSLLARDYRAGLAAYLGAVWVAAAVWAAVRRARPAVPAGAADPQ